MRKSKQYEYDAFISHAVEDKIPIANELCSRLEQAGLKIWYSGKELRVGDKVGETIHDGLNKSRFGVVIFSPTYISKMWPMREFYSLLVREGEDKVILPILYNITPEELVQKDPSMAEIFSLRADKGMDYIVEYLLTEINRIKRRDAEKARPWFGVKLLAAAIALAGVLGYYFYLPSSQPLKSPQHTVIDKAFGTTLTLEKSTIEKSIRQRIEEVTAEARRTISQLQPLTQAKEKELIDKFTDFKNLKSSYRNQFHLDTKVLEVEHKKNVEAALKMDFDTVNALNLFTLKNPTIHSKQENVANGKVYHYFLTNSAPTDFKIDNITRKSESEFIVVVSYKENIRFIHVVLSYPPKDAKIKTENRKVYRVEVVAVMPEEVFHFNNVNGGWKVAVAK